jgi:hypothetical protein
VRRGALTDEEVIREYSGAAAPQTDWENQQ